MSWMQYSKGLSLSPIVRGWPEALVVLLHHVGDSATTLTPFAARWATTVSTTAFLVLDGMEQLDPPARGLSPRPMVDRGAVAEPKELDRAARQLVPLLEQQLRSRRLDASRLVLVGFGYGGTLTLHLLLRRAWSCAGVLAFAAKLTGPLPRIFRVDHKVRLIGCAEDGDGAQSTGDVVALLTARGIDTRGVVLPGSPLSDEAVRHGGAYLGELVATAQRGNRFHVDRRNSHGQ